jgi:hypothetical protein
MRVQPAPSEKQAEATDAPISLPHCQEILDAFALRRRLLSLSSPEWHSYRLNSSRSRLVWLRLTGISVCRLSSMRN